MPAERDNSLTLAEMREMREVSGVLYKKFTEAHEYFGTHAFCFYEGEDGKYYNSRIEKYWGNNYIPLIAGNKKEVLRALRKITSDPLYDSVCVMFFVDRDFDASLVGTNRHLFETPCYSIENLYAQESSLDKILKAEFGMNVTDLDFHKCKEVYRLRLEEFIQVILRFNSVVKYQHLFAPDIHCRFSSIKTTHLAKVTLDGVTKAQRHDETIRSLIDSLSADSKVLAQLENDFDAETNLPMVLRGKNQLDLLVAMVNRFKEVNSVGGFFAEKRNCVHINITENRLGELSQYAVTPPELTEFLFAHRPNASGMS